MFALGVVELLFLNLLAVGAALSIAVRAKLEGRAETALATGLLWNALIALPIYVLGLTNCLDRTTLAWASGLLSTAILVGLTWHAPRSNANVLRVALGLVCMPFEALRDAWRAKSLVLLGLLFSAALLVWTGITAYYAPSWRQWDALWYHEPIVGFTIQNHGFSMVPLPPSGLQKINGYPRLCEMTQLWFVIFTDRRLIEAANTVVAPLLMLAVYLLTRRASQDRVAAIGWATVVMIMPATSLLLQSVYVDLHVAVFVLAAAHFCTRTPLRLRDVWLAAACLAMALGAKYLTLVPGGVLTIIVLVRVLWAHLRARPLATLMTVTGGGTLMASVAATTYLRNWIHFHNPFWPDLPYDNPRFGIHWPGLAYPVDPLNMSEPVLTVIDNLTSIPYSRSLGPATQVYEYGFVTGWFLVPLACVCCVVVLVTGLRSLLGRIFRRPGWRMRSDTLGVILLFFPLSMSLYLSPALWGARYNIAYLAFAITFISWVGGCRGFSRFSEGAVAVATVATMIMFFWQTPRWWYTPTELLTLAKIRYPAREVTPADVISPELGRASGSAITQEVGLLREKTLGRGAVLAFGEPDGSFIGLFWNNDYSNRVVFVPGGPDYLSRVHDTNAIWLYCNYGDPNLPKLRAADSGWTELGVLNVERWGTMFRRSRW